MQTLSPNANFRFLQIIASYGSFIKMRELTKTPSFELAEVVSNTISTEKHYKSLKHSFREHFPEENNTMLELLKNYQSMNEELKRKKHGLFNNIKSEYHILTGFFEGLAEKFLEGSKSFTKRNNAFTEFLLHVVPQNKQHELLNFCNEDYSLNNMSQLFNYTKQNIIIFNEFSIKDSIKIINKNHPEIQLNICLNQIEKLTKCVVRFEEAKAVYLQQY